MMQSGCTCQHVRAVRSSYPAACTMFCSCSLLLSFLVQRRSACWCQLSLAAPLTVLLLLLQQAPPACSAGPVCASAVCEAAPGVAAAAGGGPAAVAILAAAAEPPWPLARHSSGPQQSLASAHTREEEHSKKAVIENPIQASRHPEQPLAALMCAACMATATTRTSDAWLLLGTCWWRDSTAWLTKLLACWSVLQSRWMTACTRGSSIGRSCAPPAYERHTKTPKSAG